MLGISGLGFRVRVWLLGEMRLQGSGLGGFDPVQAGLEVSWENASLRSS